VEGGVGEINLVRTIAWSAFPCPINAASSNAGFAQRHARRIILKLGSRRRTHLSERTAWASLWQPTTSSRTTRHKPGRICIRGARVHISKNVSVDIPHNAITVVTGVSGSGKSSLAFDTVYAEGQRRYVESLSAYARNSWSAWEKPDVDEYSGIAPAVAIRQKI